MAIGFIWPGPFACPIRHNCLSAKYLPFMSLRSNWLCFARLSAWRRGFQSCRSTGRLGLFVQPRASPARIGFVCSQQHHSSVLSYFRYLLRGTGNSLCHLTVSVCGPARRARGRRPPLPWACLVAAISAGSRSNIRRRLGILVCCAKNQKLHRNSDRPTSPAPDDRIPGTQTVAQRFSAE